MRQLDGNVTLESVESVVTSDNESIDDSATSEDEDESEELTSEEPIDGESEDDNSESETVPMKMRQLKMIIRRRKVIFK